MIELSTSENASSTNLQYGNEDKSWEDSALVNSMSNSPVASESTRSFKNIALRQQKPSPTPKRRLRGFLVEFQGDDEARVGFEQSGEVIEYILPSKSLKKAKITQINQPFEMDEIEEFGDGSYSLTYRFRPVAPADSSTHMDYFDNSKRLNELRDAALKRFGS